MTIVESDDNCTFHEYVFWMTDVLCVRVRNLHVKTIFAATELREEGAFMACSLLSS